jgi:hypothetical protein
VPIGDPGFDGRIARVPTSRLASAAGCRPAGPSPGAPALVARARGVRRCLPRPGFGRSHRAGGEAVPQAGNGDVDRPGRAPGCSSRRWRFRPVARSAGHMRDTAGAVSRGRTPGALREPGSAWGCRPTVDDDMGMPTDRAFRGRPHDRQPGRETSRGYLDRRRCYRGDPALRSRPSRRAATPGERTSVPVAPSSLSSHHRARCPIDMREPEIPRGRVSSQPPCGPDGRHAD